MKNKQILSNDFVFLLDDLGLLSDLENKAFTLRTFVYLNNDIYLEVDKNKKFIHISLNFSKPFIEITSFAPKYLRPDTSLFAQNIKKYFANAKLSDFKQVNNDRIISFNLHKVFENYEVFDGIVYIELFSNHPNLIITNLNNQIIFAKHYTNVQSIRLILNNIEYSLPEKKFDFNKDNYQIRQYIEKYNTDLLNSIIKDQNLDIFKLLKNKKRNLIKKQESLVKQKEEYNNYYLYKEAADYIYCDLDTEHKEIDVNGNIIKLDPALDNIANANKLYKKYKKAKKGQELIDDFISKISAELEYFDKIDLQLINYNIDDIAEIRYQLTKDGYIKNKPNTKVEKPSFSPYYIEVEGVKIAYGKNSIQNDTLTFQLSKKDYYYLHIKDYHGAHVVIFDNNPNPNIIKIAAELALFLSNKDSGDIQLADVADVKKTNIKGKVLINKYELITINSYNKSEIVNLLKSSKRF